MRVLAVTSQKGGTGKTTLSGHLAVQAERQGVGPVVLVDADPQGSLSQWWNAREAETPALVQTNIGSLAEDIQQLREAGVGLVIIDTPPAITWTIIEVIKVADLVLIPVRPSPHDLGAAGATVDLVDEFGKPIVFVVNSASQRARITSEAAIALSQHGTVASSVIHHRSDFAASMIDGRTVMEIARAKRSTEEIENLWAYIEDRFDRLALGTAQTGEDSGIPQTYPHPVKDGPTRVAFTPITEEPSSLESRDYASIDGKRAFSKSEGVMG
jgi:chromosome partitioning protein